MVKFKKDKTNVNGFRIMHFICGDYQLQYTNDYFTGFISITKRHKVPNKCIEQASIILKLAEAKNISKEKLKVFSNKLDYFFDLVYTAGYFDECDDFLPENIPNEKIFWADIASYFCKGVIYVEGELSRFAEEVGFKVVKTNCGLFQEIYFLDDDIYQDIVHQEITAKYPIVEYSRRTAF